MNKQTSGRVYLSGAQKIKLTQKKKKKKKKKKIAKYPKMTQFVSVNSEKSVDKPSQVELNEGNSNDKNNNKSIL